MQLKIKPTRQNAFPLHGLLIKSSSVRVWLTEIQALNFPTQTIRVYPIPGNTANSVWGCFLWSEQVLRGEAAGKHELCQQVYPNLFIPERSSLHPQLVNGEIKKNLRDYLHVIHPDFGMVELVERLDLKSLVVLPVQKSVVITSPADAIFIPKTIKSFQVNPVPEEEVLKNLADHLLSESGQKMEDDALSLREKARLKFYKLMFSDEKETDKLGEARNKTKLFEALGKFFQGNKDLSDWEKKMVRDFEALKKRNQKQIDKFLDLMDRNPKEALKYAIPLDQHNTGRGTDMPGSFDWSILWNNFDLFGGGSSSGGGSLYAGDHFYKLQQKYRETALELIKQGDYRQAAFIYMKLLKEHFTAAETLEKGKYYEEAALIYLKYCKNELKAAECYEKANMTLKAIELYKSLGDFEKVGDLYLSIGNKKSAFTFYQREVDHYKSKHQYLKGALLCKDKMQNLEGAQNLLLEGWRLQKDAYNCLNNYFNNINDPKKLQHEIAKIAKAEVTPLNSLAFVRVIGLEYKKHEDLKDFIKETAYEIISARAPHDNSILAQLKTFNETDSEINKDVFRYKKIK